MKWFIIGFCVVMGWIERKTIADKINKTIKIWGSRKVKIDTYTTINEIVQYIESFDDIEMRAKALLALCQRLPEFNILVQSQFSGTKDTFNRTSEIYERELKEVVGHDDFKLHFGDIVKYLHSHCRDAVTKDGCPSIRNLTFSAYMNLCESRSVDIPYILRYLKGEPIFTGLINQLVYNLGFSETKKSV